MCRPRILVRPGRIVHGPVATAPLIPSRPRSMDGRKRWRELACVCRRCSKTGATSRWWSTAYSCTSSLPSQSSVQSASSSMPHHHHHHHHVCLSSSMLLTYTRTSTRTASLPVYKTAPTALCPSDVTVTSTWRHGDVTVTTSSRGIARCADARPSVCLPRTYIIQRKRWNCSLLTSNVSSPNKLIWRSTAVWN